MVPILLFLKDAQSKRISFHFCGKEVYGIKITAKINRTDVSPTIKALADVTIDDAFAVHDLKLIQGKNGLFLSMPDKTWKSGEETKHKDVFHPITAEAREDIIDAVKSAYQKHVQSAANAPDAVAGAKPLDIA